MPDHTSANICGFKFQISPTRLYMILSGLLLPPLDIADRFNICGPEKSALITQKIKDFIFNSFGLVFMIDMIEVAMNKAIVPNLGHIEFCHENSDVDPILDPYLFHFCKKNHKDDKHGHKDDKHEQKDDKHGQKQTNKVDV